jgi:glycosyltransferase involved in cell wall biosynthesis
MRILYVSPYPPVRDGIAAYAVQDVAKLRREGHDVEVLSPWPSAAHHHLDLRTPRGVAALAKRVRRYDKVVVQFHPDMFFPLTAEAKHLASAIALTGTFRLAREVEVVVHEVNYDLGQGASPSAVAMRRMWHAPDRILLHTDKERTEFLKAFHTNPERTLLLKHGRSFVRHTQHDQASARKSLGIDADVVMFLAIGFIQPHKGYDRAVRAFRGLDRRGAQLYVVGSLRVEDSSYVSYLEELRALTASTPGVHLVEGFVSDELFDRWIVAADVVVLPYRNIWSSGVLERAQLYGVPAIVTDVGGLRNQVAGRSDVAIVAADIDLRTAMEQHARTPVDESHEPWPSGGADLREQVQAEVIARAALRRGGPVSQTTTTSSSAVRSVSTPVRAVPPLAVPAPVSARVGATTAKRLVFRSTRWLIDPLIWQVNAVRDATIRALDEVDVVQRQRDEASSTDHPS